MQDSPPAFHRIWAVAHGSAASPAVMGQPVSGEPHLRDYPEGPPSQAWGAHLRIGALVEVTRPADPCRAIASAQVVAFVVVGGQIPTPIAVRVCIRELYDEALPYAAEVLQPGAMLDIALGRHLVRPMLPASPPATSLMCV